MAKEEVDYSVVNLVDDLIEKVYLFLVEQEDGGTILHGIHEFEEHQDGSKVENEPHHTYGSISEEWT